MFQLRIYCSLNFRLSHTLYIQGITKFERQIKKSDSTNKEDEKLLWKMGLTSYLIKNTGFSILFQF